MFTAELLAEIIAISWRIFRNFLFFLAYHLSPYYTFIDVNLYFDLENLRRIEDIPRIHFSIYCFFKLY